MMHPARQAYVEEDDPEVSSHSCTFYFENVHASIRALRVLDWGRLGEMERIPADGLSRVTRIRRWGWTLRIYVSKCYIEKMIQNSQIHSP